MDFDADGVMPGGVVFSRLFRDDFAATNRRNKFASAPARD
jgi:hypothetical protein